MAGYVRQSAADIAPGKNVTAGPVNDEFNTLEAAFNSSSGHSHDGTMGNGPKINLTNAVIGVLPKANGGSGVSTGAVAGPTTSTDGAIVGFDGVDGHKIKELSASDVRTAAGLGTASVKDEEDFQAANTHLDDISGLTFANKDVIQYRSGALTNRSMSQLAGDLEDGGLIIFEIGDIIFSFRNLSAEGFLALDDTTYATADYPELGAVIPPYITAPQKLSNPSSLPTGNGLGASWSPDGRYLAIAHADSPYVTIYDWNTGSPVKITNPATLPTGTGYGASWSPNGRYLAIAHSNSPYITIYDWNTGSPVKINDPASLPTGNGYSASWSPDGRYLAVAHNTSPYITIYDWDGGSPVKIDDPEDLPPFTGTGASWSPDGRYLAVCHADSPYIIIYDWDSGSPVKINNPINLPTGVGDSISWSPNGRYLAVAHVNSPYLTVYDWLTGEPEKVSDPSTLPTGTGMGVAWSSNSRYLAVAHENSPYLSIYDWQTGNPTKIPNPPSLPTNDGNEVTWAPSGRYLAIVQTVSPYVFIYDNLGYDPETEFRLPKVDYAWVRAE